MKKIKSKISIIGRGPAGVATLVQLIESVKRGDLSIGEILIFDANLEFGGVAYGRAGDTHILNTKSNQMSAFPDDIEHFTRWIKLNLNRIINRFPCLSVETVYFPRRIFAWYLEDVYGECVEKAKTLGVNIHYVQKSVLNISINEDSITVLTEEGDYGCKDVFICLGGIGSRGFKSLKDSSSFISNPWSDYSIHKDERVLILGMRLTAIDIAKDLVAKGHLGKIYLGSRSGALPKIIGINESKHRLKYLTQDNIFLLERDSSGKIPLSAVLDIFEKEIRDVTGESLEWDSILNPTKSTLDLLSTEIEKIRGGFVPLWRPVVTSTFSLMSFIWNHLSFDDRDLFNKKYKSTWISHEGGFPLESAIFLQKNMQLGQINLLKITGSVLQNTGSSLFSVSTDTGSIQVDTIIDATSSSSNVPSSENIFIQNIFKSGVAEANLSGGINIDTDNFSLIDRSGVVHNNIFAIGELTVGDWMTVYSFAQIRLQIEKMISNM